MMVANSFDLWQKDAFFTAAEEVQQSADMYVFRFLLVLMFCDLGMSSFLLFH